MLRTGVARLSSTHEWPWAHISCHGDPTLNRFASGMALDVAGWHWMPLPSNCAQAVLDSGALGCLTRLVALCGTYVGRCVEKRPA